LLCLAALGAAIFALSGWLVSASALGAPPQPRAAAAPQFRPVDPAALPGRPAAQETGEPLQSFVQEQAARERQQEWKWQRQARLLQESWREQRLERQAESGQRQPARSAALAQPTSLLKLEPAMPVALPASSMVITLETLVRDTNNMLLASSFVFTNTGTAMGTYALAFYWPNGQIEHGECCTMLAPGAAHVYDMNSGSWASTTFTGRVVISASEPSEGRILSAPAGLISGKVFESDGITPLPPAWGSLLSSYGDWMGEIRVLSDGSYALGGIPDGSYVLHFQANSPWAKQFYDRKASFESADRITISGAAQFSDIDILMQPGGIISGTITGAGGVPLANIPVDLLGGWFGVCSDSSGHYQIQNVPYGDHIVVAQPDNWNWCSDTQATYLQEYYANTHDLDLATPVTLSALDDIAEQIDFQLEPGAIIAGRITDASSGTPLPDLRVQAQDYLTGDPAFATSTDANGFYTITGILTGSYRLQARDTNASAPYYVRQWYPGTVNRNEADRLWIDAGDHLSGYDLALEQGGALTGVITDQDTGLPVGNQYVNARLMSGVSIGACSAPDGAFGIYGLVFDAGYEVSAGGSYDCFDQQNNYVLEYYDEQATSYEADLVAASSGDPLLSGIDFSLEEGGWISGTVLDQNGAPVPNLLMIGAHPRPDEGPTSYDDMAEGQTGADGSYLLGPLSQGSIDVLACASCSGILLVDEYYLDAYSLGEATPVDVVKGLTTPGIDLEISPGILVTGMVNVPDGYSPEGFEIWASSSQYYNRGSVTQADGSYVVPLPEVYDRYWNVQVTPWGSDLGMQAARNFNLALHQSWDFDLSLGATITGCVTHAGSPLINIYVGSGSAWGGGDSRTGLDGCYTMTNLPIADDVTVWADGWPNYASQDYGGYANYGTPPLSTQPGETLGKIDFEMDLLGQIEGDVFEEDGATPVEGVRVTALNEKGFWYAYTQPDGHFTLDVPEGQHRLFFDWEGGLDVIPTYYPGVSTHAAASLVSVPPLSGGALNISQLVQRPAELSGLVTAQGSGDPLEGIHVAVLNTDPAVNREAAAWACTDASGAYAISGIWPGQNQVSVLGSCGDVPVAPVTTTFTAVSGDSHMLNFSLASAPPPERPLTVWAPAPTDFPPAIPQQNFYDVNNSLLAPALYTPLAQLDNQGQWFSDLLTQLPSLANGGVSIAGDQMLVTYQLKPGLLWSDGEPLSSADIRFAWQWMTSVYAQMYDPWSLYYLPLGWIEAVDTPDAQTAIVRYRAGYRTPGYLSAIPYPLPEHSLAGSYPGDLSKYAHFSHYPVGNGPYLVTDWVPGSHLDLHANPHYVKRDQGLPATADLRVRFTGDPFNSVASGQADLGLNAQNFLPPDYASYDLNVSFTPQNGYAVLAPNTNLPAFADAQVRKALYHALERPLATSAPSLPADAYLNPQHPFYTTGITSYAYDLSLAASMLDAAGWIDHNADGIRDKDGVELTFDLALRSGQTIALVLAGYQSDLASIGVDLNFVYYPTTRLNNLRRRGELDMIFVSWFYDDPFDPMLYSLMHSRAIPSAYNGYNGWGWINGFWSSPGSDALLDTAGSELDFAALGAALDQHQALWTAELPVLPLFHSENAYVASPTLLNFQPGGNSVPTWNIEEWRIPDLPYDLAIRKALAAGSDAPQPGATISYTLQVRNNGYFPVHHALLGDTLPPEVTFVSASPAPTQIDGQDLEWELGRINGNSDYPVIEVAVSIPASTPHGTLLVNQAFVGGDEPDSRPENNLFSHTAEVRDDVNLQISKSGVGQPAIGEHYDYYLQYANWGGAPASGVIITDILPPEVSLIAADPAPTVNGRTLTWLAPTLPGNQWGGQIHIETEIDQSGVVANTASLAADQPDADPTNNSDVHVESITDILAPLMVRPTSGSVDLSPTVSGYAPSGSEVQVWNLLTLDVGQGLPLPFEPQDSLLVTTTASISGTFSVELSLPAAGAYTLATRAIKGGLTSAYSNTAHVVAKTSLPLDPDLVKVSSEGVDLSNGSVEAQRNALSHRMLDLQAVIPCGVAPDAGLRVTENGLFTYTQPPVNLTNLGGGQWRVEFRTWLAEVHSSYDIWLLWECAASHKEVLLIYVWIDPDGYLYDQALVDSGAAVADALIANGVVTIYNWLNESWNLWPAAAYGQTNPQITDGSSPDGVLTSGYYSFLTPPGQYRIEALAPGYQPYQSPVITVITTPVRLDIGLLPVSSGELTIQAPSDLSASYKTVSQTSASIGDELTYDIWLVNDSDTPSGELSLSDLLSWHAIYSLASVDASSGSAGYDEAAGQVWWQGVVPAHGSVHIQYRVTTAPENFSYLLSSPTQVSGEYVDLFRLPALVAETQVEVVFILNLPFVALTLR
jgi:peptide/nickel transport system substrate-binding protein